MRAPKPTKICVVRMFVGAGLEGTEGANARHRVVIDTRELWAVVERATNMFEGATITEARGRWKGRGEPTLIVEVWDDASKCGILARRARLVAAAIVKKLDQVAVAVVGYDQHGPNVSYVVQR